ncbi:MAG: SEL1-like repeat protein [Verrucomicrobiaceae bacterium]|nr:SEL1-like repeat protein [Verrucomicrobiaceae bacterium]
MPADIIHDDPFSDYIERGLAFEQSYGSGGGDALKAKEAIAWRLHEQGSAAGGMLLGDSLISGRVSFLRKDIQVVSFARELVVRSFQALNAIADKTHWDWYYLGLAHESGRGTTVDYSQAVECYRRSKELGNPYAEFEEIWFEYLARSNILEAILRFRSCEGRLKHFAEATARALSLLALGPVREMGSYQHAWRIFELSRLLHVFLYHDKGQRQLHIAIEAEWRAEVPQLEVLGTASSALVLFLIAKRSRCNPTSQKALHWLRLAARPDSQEFFAIVKGQLNDEDELRLLSEVCAENQWGDSELARFVASEIDLL